MFSTQILYEESTFMHLHFIRLRNLVRFQNWIILWKHDEILNFLHEFWMDLRVLNIFLSSIHWGSDSNTRTNCPPHICTKLAWFAFQGCWEIYVDSILSNKVCVSLVVAEFEQNLFATSTVDLIFFSSMEFLICVYGKPALEAHKYVGRKCGHIKLQLRYGRTDHIKR